MRPRGERLRRGLPHGREPQLRGRRDGAVAAASVRDGGGARVERALLEGPVGSLAVVV